MSQGAVCAIRSCIQCPGLDERQVPPSRHRAPVLCMHQGQQLCLDIIRRLVISQLVMRRNCDRRSGVGGICSFSSASSRRLGRRPARGTVLTRSPGPGRILQPGIARSLPHPDSRECLHHRDTRVRIPRAMCQKRPLLRSRVSPWAGERRAYRVRLLTMNSSLVSC